MQNSPADSDAPPKTLGRFEILRELGLGGSGVVFSRATPRWAASSRSRFHGRRRCSRPACGGALREAQAAAGLTHPNLVSVYEIGEAGGVCFIASAYCQGPNLAEWLKQRVEPVPCQLAARIVAELADGIHCAHDEGVLHRDLKPANVLLEPLGDELHNIKPQAGAGRP